MKRFIPLAFPAVLALAACSTAPETNAGLETLHIEVQSTVDDFKTQDPTMQRLFDTAYGYAVFPEITTGGAGLAFAGGRGEVFVNHSVVGNAKVTQASIGAQLGGQKYSEIIFFESQGAYASFRSGELAFDARATAIAASHGAAATADYRNGVAVFTIPQGGLMFQAAVGGQKFSFTARGNPATRP